MPRHTLIVLLTYFMKFVLHFLIWLLVAVLLFLYPAIAHKGQDLPGDFTIKQIVHYLFMVSAYYFNAHFLVKVLLFQGRHLLYAASLIAVVFASTYSLAMVESALNLRAQMEHIWGKREYSQFFDLFGFLTTLITAGISTSIAVISKMNRDNKIRLAMEKEQATAELTILKAQIHPHFFFNTLNSIYSLSFTDAEGSRKILTRLSNIMRYLLYESQGNLTTLDKEVSFISNYIEVMKKRLNTNTRLEVNLPSAAPPLLIAPMILMTYVENVFKHGVDEADNTLLYVNLTLTGNCLELVTQNPVTAKPALIAEGTPGGIGMQNTLRRLELLYKDRFELSTHTLTHTNEFICRLKLIL